MVCYGISGVVNSALQSITSETIHDLISYRDLLLTKLRQQEIWYVPLSTVDEIPTVNHSIKAAEQYFHVALLILLYKVVLTFESVDEIL